MRSRELSSSMWSEALSLLERADRLHRYFFRLASAADQCWEPPIDVAESDDALVVHIALPGVPATAIAIGVEPDAVTVSGVRRFPAPQAACIHRIEIPYGRFERRIPLPMHALDLSRREVADGCLVLTFRKLKEMP